MCNVTCAWHRLSVSLPTGLSSLKSPNRFFAELQKWRCPDYYENNVHKMQLPFSSKLLGSTLTAEEKQERRQQQLRRLQELNARRREEKLQLDQERLERLLYVQVRAARCSRRVLVSSAFLGHSVFKLFYVDAACVVHRSQGGHLSEFHRVTHVHVLVVR